MLVNSPEFYFHIEFFKYIFIYYKPSGAIVFSSIVADHFVLVLCGVDIKFTLQLGDRNLPQAEHQLNLLPKSTVDPSKSTFEVM